MATFRILQGNALDVLATLPDESVNCCVTSPPYWGLRDYGEDSQIGREPTPEQYVESLVAVFREVRRVLAVDGTLWLNLGDKLLRKQLTGIPWRLALALQEDGWRLRSEIIWHKPNQKPESVKDRPTKSHEHIFLLAKSDKYYYDHEAIKEKSIGKWNNSSFNDSRDLYLHPSTGKRPRVEAGTRNKRSVWTVATRPYSGAHFAVFPVDLIEPCVLAGCPKGGTVLDPFNGAGTTGLVALRNERNYLGIELKQDYIHMSERRIAAAAAQ